MIIKSYMFTMASLAIEVVCLRNVVATVCLLLLHSIKLTLVTMVIFFELVIFVRLGVLCREFSFYFLSMTTSNSPLVS